MPAVVEQVESLVKANRFEEAQAAVQKAGADELTDGNREYCQGLLFEAQCQWPEAIEAYSAAAEREQIAPGALFRLATLADRFGDDELALDLYEELTRDANAPVNALLNLAVLYEDQERYEDAQVCVKRVVEEYPNHTRARLFLKDVSASRDMYYDEEGERYLEKRDALLETPISEFELSVRSRNCLRQMNLHTLGDLLRTTPAELLAYKNFGETSLHEIEAILAQKGLRIGQLLEEKESSLIAALTPQQEDSTQSGLLSRSVAELELYVRSRKCLMRLGISTIGELANRTEAELLAIKNFGMTSLSEIKRRLAEIGISLRND